MARVVFDHITKRFGDVTAVNDLNIEILDEEFLVLVGPSGCGKTTALRMIAGLEQITSGDLYIGGRRVNDVLERDRDIAMVFQSYALYPHMTVAQNIAFSLKLAKVPKRELKERVANAARLLGLEALLDRRPKQLSGGQRQRVAMGRAIVRQPQAFLMDEPLSNLDAQLRVHMRGEIQSLQKRLSVTTVYVTHDQVEAMTMGDRVAVMRDGLLQQVDSPSNVYDSPANLFVAGFIGSPPMNLAEATVEKANGRLAVSLGETKIPLPERARLDEWAGRKVIVGLRPEDLHGPRAGSDGKVKIPAKVDRVEALGAQLLVYFNVDAPLAQSAGVAAALGADIEEVTHLARSGSEFCATFEPRTGVRVGDEVSVTVDVDRLHFFDPETEDALSS
jgi:multiple sugar transport system ATP-binding protein